ncbi:MAG TPA: hypothetical protein VEL74_06110 [Thermoanaerobaculia bacterium]|nr:hypothetical protein [Thermoanaerobaculia bacterium]
MFRSFLYRGVILSGVVCLCLLPLAEAHAVPAERGGGVGAAVERTWSAEWAEAVRGLLAGLWGKDSAERDRTVEVDPPNGKGDGTGIDPHGGPRPRQSQRPQQVAEP